MKKTFAAALTALAIVGTVAATNTQAQANPIEAGAAIVGGALYAGATVVGAAGAVVAAPFVGPYYYAGYPSCRFVQRYDYWGNYVRTDRICGPNYF